MPWKFGRKILSENRFCCIPQALGSRSLQFAALPPLLLLHVCSSTFWRRQRRRSSSSSSSLPPLQAHDIKVHLKNFCDLTNFLHLLLQGGAGNFFRISKFHLFRKMCSCHSRFCRECRTRNYIRKRVCANPHCVLFGFTKYNKRNKGRKRREWWARRQRRSRPRSRPPPDLTPDTDASSSTGGQGQTIVETPGIQASFRIKTFLILIHLLLQFIVCMLQLF